MKQWKQIADASDPPVPDIERIAPTLEALEAAFRPLAKAIPHDVEPALIFHASADDLEDSQ